MYGALARSNDALAAYQRVFHDYGADPAPTLREQVAEALAHMGYWLVVLGRSNEALAAYQRVIDDYGSDPAAALREQVAKALVAKGRVEVALLADSLE